MPQFYEVVKITGLEKVQNPEILRQFVRADREIKDEKGTAPAVLAQAIRNALQEVRK